MSYRDYEEDTYRRDPYTSRTTAASSRDDPYYSSALAAVGARASPEYHRGDDVYRTAPTYSHAYIEGVDDYYDRSLKRRRSPSPAYLPRAQHDPYAPSRSPGPSLPSYRIDPTRTDPEYLEWAARQRAKANAWMDAQVGERWERLDAEERMREWEVYQREQLYEARERERRAYKERDAYDSDTYARYADADDRYAPRRRYDEDEYALHGRYGSADIPGRDPPPPLPEAERRAPMHPLEFQYLMPFKDYAVYLRERLGDPIAIDSSSSAELFAKYQEYRLRFQRKKMDELFRENKKKPWFVERYGTGEREIKARQRRRKLGRTGKKKAWLSELEEGKLDRVSNDILRIESNIKDSKAGGRGGGGGREGKGKASLTVLRRDGEEEHYKDESVWISSDPCQILIRHVPADMERDELEEVASKQSGYKYLALGEPHPLKEYGRTGWIAFERAADAAAAVKTLNDYVFPSNVQLTFEVANRPASVRLRICPEYSCALVRLAHDLRQARELVAKFQFEDREELWAGEKPEDAATWLDVDATAAISKRCAQAGYELDEALLDSLLGQQAPSAEDIAADEETPRRKEVIKKHLDLHLDLLQHAYHCDYYGSIVCDFAEELERRSPRHLRRCPPKGSTNAANEKPRESGPGSASSDQLWADGVDRKVALLIRPGEVDLEAYGGENLVTKMQEFAAPFSQMDDENKHHCTVMIGAPGAEKVCGKPFMAPVFVQKHVVNKHRAFMESKFGDEIAEIKLFNSYVSDPVRVMPQLNAPPPAPVKSVPSAAAGATGSLAARLGFDSPSAHGSSYLVDSPIRLGEVMPSYPTGGAGAGGSSVGGGGEQLIRLGRTMPAPVTAVDSPSGRLMRVGGGGGGGGQRSSSPVGMNGRGGYGNGASLGSRLGDRVADGADLANGGGGAKPLAEPLPEPPRPLDPRARQAPTSYQDLDGGAPESDELELEY